MIKQLSEISSKEELEELKEVIKNLNSRMLSVTMTLTQFLKNPLGNVNRLELSKKDAEGKATVSFNNGYINLHIDTKSRDFLPQLKEMWKTYLKRGTEKAVQGEDNDYIMSVTLLFVDDYSSFDTTAYEMDCHIPIFVTKDDDEIELVFKYDTVTYALETLDSNEIYDEMQYKNATDESTFTDNDEVLNVL